MTNDQNARVFLIELSSILRMAADPEDILTRIRVAVQNESKNFDSSLVVEEKQPIGTTPHPRGNYYGN